MFDKLGRGIITWRELGALMKALGIPDIPMGLLNRVNAEQTPENSPGLEYKPFVSMLQNDMFASTLDYSYNRHNSTYNIRVIKKSLAMIVDGFLTLEDLRAARLGFTLYEGETCNGIQLDAESVTVAMRVTGKAIAPKKLLYWLDSVEEDVPGRLQLYEFLDIVKLCNDRTELTKSIPNATTNVDRSKAGLFELTEPSNFLLTPNQKLAKHMDEDYDSMVNLINNQQLPQRETLTTAKKSSSSPDFHNYLLTSKSTSTKRIEDSLDFYGQIRDTIKSSATNVQAIRTTHSSAVRPSTTSSSRPRSALIERKGRLPQLSVSTHTANRRSTSVPAMRVDSYQKIPRAPDLDDREMAPRHMTASAPPILRGGFVKVNSGEASLARVVTSSIGGSHKHVSPPSSPTFRSEDRKKKSKPKRVYEEQRKSLKSSHKDHKFSMDSLANNLEDMMHGSRPHTHDMARSTSTKRVTLSDENDQSDAPTLPAAATSTTPEPHRRPRTMGDGRNITFNLTATGDQN